MPDSTRSYQRLVRIPPDPSNLVARYTAPDGASVEVLSGVDFSPRDAYSPLGHIVLFAGLNLDHALTKDGVPVGLERQHDRMCALDEYWQDTQVERKAHTLVEMEIVHWGRDGGYKAQEYTPNSGSAGVIYITGPERKDERMTADQVMDYMRGEVEGFSAWRTGDCFTIMVTEIAADGTESPVVHDCYTGDWEPTVTEVMTELGYLLPDQSEPSEPAPQLEAGVG